MIILTSLAGALLAVVVFVYIAHILVGYGLGFDPLPWIGAKRVRLINTYSGKWYKSWLPKHGYGYVYSDVKVQPIFMREDGKVLGINYIDKWEYA